MQKYSIPNELRKVMKCEYYEIRGTTYKVEEISHVIGYVTSAYSFLIDIENEKGCFLVKIKSFALKTCLDDTQITGIHWIL